jgi:hypothetical protein
MKRIMANLLRVLVIVASLSLQLLAVVAQDSGFTLLTITNPAPVAGDSFGISLAAVGDDLMVIGAIGVASAAGAAYLFRIDGTLVATFTNPTPAAYDHFGRSVAALGYEWVLIGAYLDDLGATDAGAAYLFRTNGTLLTTFTNPAPAATDGFGWSLVAVGSDRVLVGAYLDDLGATDAGAAYLFSTNGTLLTTFTNPTPAPGDHFSWSVAAVGSNRVLIGSPWDSASAGNAGAAYLFNTKGILLTTFTNPPPAAYDYFGYSVAAVGNDRVLIGAHLDDVGVTNAGAAYLFSTNGTLLTTFTNPAPAAEDSFGACVSAVGSDRVLIGAYGANAGGEDAGAVYLLDTSGTLLNTFTNPTPVSYDYFGYSLAVLGADQLLIGAHRDNTGAIDAGVGYFFNLRMPSLTIQLTTTNTVAVSWASPSTGWMLQQNTNSVGSVNWSNSPGTIQDNGITKTLIVNPPTGNRFYRLFKP